MKQNFSTYRGDDFTFTVTFKDSAGVAFDITGWTVFCTLKTDKSLSDANASVSKTITSFPDGDEGIANITLTNTDTASLLGTYFYDIQYKDINGIVKTVLEGTICFNEDITRRTT